MISMDDIKVALHKSRLGSDVHSVTTQNQNRQNSQEKQNNQNNIINAKRSRASSSYTKNKGGEGSSNRKVTFQQIPIQDKISSQNENQKSQNQHQDNSPRDYNSLNQMPDTLSNIMDAQNMNFNQRTKNGNSTLHKSIRLSDTDKYKMHFLRE